jgi:hypothetical protein
MINTPDGRRVTEEQWNEECKQYISDELRRAVDEACMSMEVELDEAVIVYDPKSEKYKIMVSLL